MSLFNESTMIANRRKYVRIKANRNPCQFELNGMESNCVVVDESIEGIRVSGLDLTRLSLDQKITIHYKGVTIIGRCRSISRNPDGTFRVGVFRESAEYEHAHKAFLLNTFMRCNRFEIVCTVNETIGTDQLHVELLDGKTFVLDRDRVIKRTRTERHAKLEAIVEDEEKFDELQAIYSSLTGKSFQEPEVDSILAQEFGPVAP